MEKKQDIDKKIVLKDNKEKSKIETKDNQASKEKVLNFSKDKKEKENASIDNKIDQNKKKESKPSVDKNENDKKETSLEELKKEDGNLNTKNNNDNQQNDKNGNFDKQDNSVKKNSPVVNKTTMKENGNLNEKNNNVDTKEKFNVDEVKDKNNLESTEQNDDNKQNEQQNNNETKKEEKNNEDEKEYINISGGEKILGDLGLENIKLSYILENIKSLDKSADILSGSIKKGNIYKINYLYKIFSLFEKLLNITDEKLYKLYINFSNELTKGIKKTKEEIKKDGKKKEKTVLFLEGDELTKHIEIAEKIVEVSKKLNSKLFNQDKESLLKLLIEQEYGKDTFNEILKNQGGIYDIKGISYEYASKIDQLMKSNQNQKLYINKIQQRVDTISSMFDKEKKQFLPNEELLKKLTKDIVVYSNGGKELKIKNTDKLLSKTEGAYEELTKINETEDENEYLKRVNNTKQILQKLDNGKGVIMNEVSKKALDKGNKLFYDIGKGYYTRRVVEEIEKKRKNDKKENINTDGTFYYLFEKLKALYEDFTMRVSFYSYLIIYIVSKISNGEEIRTILSKLMLFSGITLSLALVFLNVAYNLLDNNKLYGGVYYPSGMLIGIVLVILFPLIYINEFIEEEKRILEKRGEKKELNGIDFFLGSLFNFLSGIIILVLFVAIIDSILSYQDFIYKLISPGGPLYNLFHYVHSIAGYNISGLITGWIELPGNQGLIVDGTVLFLLFIMSFIGIRFITDIIFDKIILIIVDGLKGNNDNKENLKLLFKTIFYIFIIMYLLFNSIL